MQDVFLFCTDQCIVLHAVLQKFHISTKFTGETEPYVKFILLKINFFSIHSRSYNVNTAAAIKRELTPHRLLMTRPRHGRQWSE